MYSRGDGRAYSSFIHEVGLGDETRENHYGSAPSPDAKGISAVCDGTQNLATKLGQVTRDAKVFRTFLSGYKGHLQRCEKR